jgi:hypothetical protein
LFIGWLGRVTRVIGWCLRGVRGLWSVGRGLRSVTSSIVGGSLLVRWSLRSVTTCVIGWSLFVSGSLGSVTGVVAGSVISDRGLVDVHGRAYTLVDDDGWLVIGFGCGHVLSFGFRIARLTSFWCLGGLGLAR